MYKKLLKVRDKNKKQIFAKIYPGQENVQIVVDYLEQVEKDKPPFANKGIIKIQVKKTEYAQRDNEGITVIDRLTKYLESLFLKELADEDSHTSHAPGNQSGGSVKKPSAGKTPGDKGKGQTSGVRNSAGGDKPAEASAGRDGKKVDMAEGTDSEDKQQD